MSVDIDLLVRDCEASLDWTRRQIEKLQVMEAEAEANLRRVRELRYVRGLKERDRVLRVVKG